MRTIRSERLRLSVLFASVAISACSGGIPGFSSSAKADAGGDPASVYVDTSADDKSQIYNLVGRWYPEEEIKRLSDRTLTPEQWCEREPTVIFVVPDRVEVRCNKGAPSAAMIAEAKRGKDGAVTLYMRAKEDSSLRALEFKTRGPTAVISGSPCFEGPMQYSRFPEYEILTREVLGGRRCAQFASQHTELPSNPVDGQSEEP